MGVIRRLIDLSSEYLSKKLTSPVKDILYLITSTILAILVGIIVVHEQSTSNYLLIIYILVTLLLLSILIYVLLYHKTINVDVVNKLTSTRIPTVRIIRKSKTIIIGKDFFKNTKGHQRQYSQQNNKCDCDCTIKICIELDNQTTECYPKYRVGIESNCFVPSVDEIDAEITSNPSVGKHSLEKSEYRMWLQKPYVNGKEASESGIECEFYIPLNLAGNSSTNISISYPTSAFLDLLDEKVEYTSMEVMQETDLIEFLVILDKELRQDYFLSDSENKIENNCRVSYHITDASKQRMRVYEEELKKYNKIPIFKKKNIRWSVPNPIVGCNYTLFFTLKKKK